MSERMPRHAMVFAAGLGTRMRPVTDTIPKPLVKVAGRALIDHVLDRLALDGVETAIVNVHYMVDQIEQHLAGRTAPRIIIHQLDALPPRQRRAFHAIYTATAPSLPRSSEPCFSPPHRRSCAVR